MMPSVLALAAMVAAAAWAFLLAFRGGFWRADQRLDAESPLAPPAWPAVVAVVPARDEAPTVGRAVASLLAQDYAGSLHVVVVDDNSADGTAAAAVEGAEGAAAGGRGRFSLVAGQPLPAGWSGKLWAVEQGLQRAAEALPEATFVLLADADVEHHAGTLARLVGKAEAEGLDLVSLMVRLRCESFWERLLIPAFVFFFQKLYPFARVNDPARPEAAAAGGCMLVRRAALARAGGIAAIRDRLIDDCALAALIKAGGPIWLGLARRTVSLRAYDGLGPIWAMVARTAFVQLDRSALLLAGTVAGMVLLYLAPPLGLVAGLALGDSLAAAAGAAGWLLMSAAYRPTQALYGRPVWAAPALPLAALLYTLMTVDSARRQWQGRGGGWKGRAYGGANRAGG